MCVGANLLDTFLFGVRPPKGRGDMSESSKPTAPQLWVLSRPGVKPWFVGR